MSQTRDSRPFALALLAISLAGAPLRAQEPALSPATVTTTTGDPVPEATPAPVGPTLDAATAGVGRPAAEKPALPLPPAADRHSQGTNLMIIGGAAILTGIVVGTAAGGAISVGGAVIGLYGLYLYLQ